MVLDLLPGPNSSAPEKLTVAGTTLFFTAWDETRGRELWKSDGTAKGTTLVKDIQQGPKDGRIGDLVSMAKVLYFAADDGVTGVELWKADQQGASMVVDLRPKSLGANPRGFVVIGNQIYFIANDGKTGQELWKSDGTKKGTLLVADLTPGTGSSWLSGLTVAQDVLYFTTRHYSKWPYYNKLWRSDGTTKGTFSFHTVGIGNWPITWAPLGRKIVYSSPLKASSANTIWVSDGTISGTKSLIPGTRWRVGALKTVKNRVYFTKWVGALQELWMTDGTVKGTQWIKNLITWNKTAHAGKLYFITDAPQGFTGYDFWVSDGTAKGTVIVRSFRKVKNKDRPELFSAGSMLLLSVDDGIVGRELWRSDGTKKGTTRIMDLNPPSATGSSNPMILAQVGSWTYFSADDGLRGHELWKTDSTPQGTTLVLDIQPGAKGSKPGSAIALGDQLLFVAEEDKAGRELWISDGRAKGTRLVKDIYPGPNLTFVRDLHLARLTLVGDRVFFMATDGKHGYELWVSDGTTAGTRMVVDLVKGYGSSIPHYITAFRGEAFFLAYDPLVGGFLSMKLWRSDGTAKGTSQVSSLKVRNLRGFKEIKHALAVYRGHLYFSASDGKARGELYRSDGTSKGTKIVINPAPGKILLFPTEFHVLEDMLFFRAHDYTYANELWKTDGTVSGTRVVKDLDPGRTPPGSSPVPNHSMGKRVLVIADNSRYPNDPYRKKDLWISDGTTVGTTLLLRQGITASMAGGSRRTWFLREARTQSGLWVTDGTVAGTKAVVWYPTGAVPPGHKTVSLARGRILFSHWDPRYGRELWVIDPGATAQRVGRACSRSAMLPSLAASDPVLGATVVFSGYKAPAQSLALLFAGRRARQPVRLGRSCELYFDLSLQVLLTSFLTQKDSWNHGFALPKTPSLLGIQVMAQAVFLNARSGLSVTPGQFLTLGF